MKPVVNIVRILVGLLFVFSGLVKANDPLGLSYKMEEFFEIWGLTAFNDNALLMSVLLNAFEIIAGFALLLGWRIRLFIWLLLGLILLFTFLTGYTYYTGKPANCGCFGDCLPISSQTSFFKDVALTILIGFLWWKQHLLKPLLAYRRNTILMLLVTLFGFGFQWYTLSYMPVVDCLPYKVNNSIPEKMKMPANAIPDSTVISFVYEKDGQQVEFTADKFPDDFSSPPYIFKSRYDKVVRKGSHNEPPIKGFVLTGVSGTDSTLEILSQPYAILLFIENFSLPLSKWQHAFEKIHAEAVRKNIPVYAISTNIAETASRFAPTGFAGIPLFTCDYTAIRTAARTSPAFYLLKEGTIMGKWSRHTLEGLSELLAGIPARDQLPGIPAAADTSSSQPSPTPPNP